ncbi:MAG: hypothetical protein ACRD3C_02955 [Vicinamibacterales bacterium]
MTQRVLGAVALVVALALPSFALAHVGHAHKVMGTVSNVDGSHLMVKTTDGKTVMVMLDAKTKIVQGKVKVAPGALKVGDRIVAEGAQDKDMLMATSVQVGTAPAAAKKPGS